MNIVWEKTGKWEQKSFRNEYKSTFALLCIRVMPHTFFLAFAKENQHTHKYADILQPYSVSSICQTVLKMLPAFDFSRQQFTVGMQTSAQLNACQSAWMQSTLSTYTPNSNKLQIVCFRSNNFHNIFPMCILTIVMNFNLFSRQTFINGMVVRLLFL